MPDSASSRLPARPSLDQLRIIALLLDLGVPLEIEDRSKVRVLHHAGGNNALRAARFLIDRGEMIEVLMKYGARVPALSKWGAFYYFKHEDLAAMFSSAVWIPTT
jgi:hypothetical protein